MPTGKMWMYRLLSLMLFVVRLRISLPRIKLAASNFARWFHFGHFASQKAPLKAQNQIYVGVQFMWGFNTRGLCTCQFVQHAGYV